MKRRVWSRGGVVAFGVIVALGALGFGLQGNQVEEDTTTTIFLVRHAEKMTDVPNDPDLSDQELARSARLAEMLQDQTISAIFVTRTLRSYQTAIPIADASGVEPTEYPPTDTAHLLEQIDKITGGGSVLIVAHSNTVPMILKALGGRDMPKLDEDEYDRFIVVVRDDGEHVKTIELRF